MCFLVFCRAYRDITYRTDIARHRFDALLVVANHHMSAYLRIFELKMVQEQLQRRTPLGFVDHGNLAILAAQLLPMG